MLWLRLTNPRTRQALICAAVVDTGADDCSCPADWAMRLGHNLEVVPAKEINTANGTTRAYPHTTLIEVLGVSADGRANENEVLHEINDALVDYTKGLNTFLLGRKTFLDRFTLFINYPERKLSIRWPRTEQTGGNKKKRHH
jgi:predicted aspartyl protease